MIDRGLIDLNRSLLAFICCTHAACSLIIDTDPQLLFEEGATSARDQSHLGDIERGVPLDVSSLEMDMERNQDLVDMLPTDIRLIDTEGLDISSLDLSNIDMLHPDMEPVDMEPVDMEPPQRDWMALLEELNALLPNDGCVMELDNSCIARLQTPLPLSCSGWAAHLNRATPFPWSGDRESCDGGQYDPQGINDFTQALNLRRSYLHLDPVSVTSSQEMQLCALATDIELISNQPFRIGSACYSPDRFDAYSASGKMRLSRSFSLYQHLYKTLDIHTNDFPLEGLLPQRHFLLTHDALTISVAERGQSACLRLEERAEPSGASPPVLYPGVGLLPFELVAPERRGTGEQVWSLSWPSLDITFPAPLIVSKRVGGQWEPVMIESNLFTVDEPILQTIIALLPQEPPEADTLYRVEGAWSHQGATHTLRYYSYFVDCGFTQPLACEPLSSDCRSLGRVCILDRFNRQQSYCAWPGPLARGERCTYGEPHACREGECMPNTSQDPQCMSYCSPETNGSNPQSCAALCEDISTTTTVSDRVSVCY